MAKPRQYMPHPSAALSSTSPKDSLVASLPKIPGASAHAGRWSAACPPLSARVGHPATNLDTEGPASARASAARRGDVERGGAGSEASAPRSPGWARGRGGLARGRNNKRQEMSCDSLAPHASQDSQALSGPSVSFATELGSEQDGAVLEPGSGTLSFRDSMMSNVSSQKSLVPWSRRLVEVESRLRDRFNTTMESLSHQLLTDSEPLREDLSELSLNEHFDDLGGGRFPRLGGLMFAARQHRSPIGNFFGSRSERTYCDVQEYNKTRSELAAAEAKERDMEYGRKWVSGMVRNISDAEKHCVEDVKWRQLEVIFIEVPSWHTFLPAGAGPEDLLPLDVEKSLEQNVRSIHDRENKAVFSFQTALLKECRWSFTRPEVFLMLQMAELWSKSTRGAKGSRGVDRATFCRFLLDLGLVDQERVPLFWAVSLFDSQARNMRYISHCFTEINITVSVVSWKGLVSIMDVIMKQLSSVINKRSFMASLWPIARMRLPAAIIKESGFQSDHNLELAGRMRRTGFGWQQVDEEGRVVSDAQPGSPRGARRETVKEEGPLPDFLRSPEHPLTTSELGREEQARDCLLACLLVEPEVLHVIAQHRALFEVLHGAYSDADDPEHMSYVALHRFCVDLGFVPALTSAHALRRIYETTKCVRSSLLEEEGGSPKSSRRPSAALLLPPEVTAIHPAGPASGPALPASFGELSRQSSLGSEPSASVSRQASGESGAISLHPNAKLARTAQSSIPWARVAQIARSSSKGPSGASKAAAKRDRNSESASSFRPRSSGSHILDKLADGEDGKRGGRELWAKAVPGRSLSDSLPRAIFGPGALAEALCRIAFGYLTFYGNSQQQSMNALARAVWLLSFMGAAITRLQQSASAADLPDGPLRTIIRTVSLEVFHTPACDREVLANGLPRAVTRELIHSEEEVDPLKDVRRRTQVAPAGRKDPGQRQRKSIDAAAAADLGAAHAAASPSVSRQISEETESRQISEESRQNSDEEQATQDEIRMLEEAVKEGSTKEGSTPGCTPRASHPDDRPAWGNEEDDDRRSSASAGSKGSKLNGKRRSKTLSRLDKVPVLGIINFSDHWEQEIQMFLSLSLREQVVVKGSDNAVFELNEAGQFSKEPEEEQFPLTIFPKADSRKDDQNAAAIEDIPKHPPLGTACIQDNICVLCKVDLASTPWGRSTCYGCSIVDVCRFRQHFFKPLLLDYPSGMQPAALTVTDPVPTYKAVIEHEFQRRKANLPGKGGRDTFVPLAISATAAFTSVTGSPPAAPSSTSADAPAS